MAGAGAHLQVRLPCRRRRAGAGRSAAGRPRRARTRRGGRAHCDSGPPIALSAAAMGSEWGDWTRHA